MILLFAQKDCTGCDNTILKLYTHNIGAVVQAAEVDDLAAIHTHHLLSHHIVNAYVLNILIGGDVDKC